VIQSVLAKVARKINEKNITWAVGASVLLNHHNLIENPRDIDILVAEEEIEAIHSVLIELGDKVSIESKKPFLTKYFYHYIVEGVEIDVMGAFKIQHEDGVYELEFDRASITSKENINGVDVPFSSLEDWFVLYQLIPGREKKVELIQDELKEKGIKNPQLLERALSKQLPASIKGRINGILK